MFFTSICVYTLLEKTGLTPDALEEKLSARPFREIGRLDLSSVGFVPPLGSAGVQLVHTTDGRMMFCVQEEKKILPPAVVRRKVDERVAERQEREGRTVRKKEKDQIKDEVILELLPQCFTKVNKTYAYLDPRAGVLIVNSASWKAAEQLTEFLREALGSLPIAPPVTRDAPESIMTDWLAKGQAAPSVELGGQVLLEDPQSSGTQVSAKRHDLICDEIRQHIRSGKRARRLEFSWSERILCVFDADMSLKKLKFSDVVQEESAARDPESAAERFDVDFAIMGLELDRFLPALFELFGGLEERAAA